MSAAATSRLRHRGSAARDDAGAVTAELALALPAVVLVVAVLLVTAAAASAQLRCADGARTGARVAALGQSDAEVAAVVQQVTGSGTVVEVIREPPWVDVVVTADLPGSWFTAGHLRVAARAAAWVEP